MMNFMVNCAELSNIAMQKSHNDLKISLFIHKKRN